MVSRRFLSTVAPTVLIVLLFSLLPAAVTAATYTLSGRVTDQSGNAIANTLVEVVDPSTGAPVANFTTDSRAITP